MKEIDTMQEFVEWLEGLADGSIQPFDEECGLCYQIEEVYDGYMTYDFKDKWDDLIEIDDIYESWDKFSGIQGYPVPAPNNEEGILCPKDIYTSYAHNDLSKWEGAYGDLRKELCQHVANELRKLA